MTLNLAMTMTLNEAIFDLHLEGLPYPSPFSVFFLYYKIGERYRRVALFDNNFRELLEIQKSIQKGDFP